MHSGESPGKLQLLASIVDSADDAIISKTLDGIITSWNGAAEAMYGYPAEEMIGRPVSLLVPPDRAEDVEKILGRIREGQRVAHYETVRLRKDGSTVDISLTVSPVHDADGRIVGASAIARDITQRRRAQAKFEGLLQAAPDAMVGVHRDGTIAFVNHQAETLFGYDRDELLGRPVEILVPEQIRERHPGHRAHYFANPQVRPMGAGLNLSARRKDGSEFPAEISLSSIDTEEGLLVTAAVRDVTERKRIQAKFEGLLEAAPDAMLGVHRDGTIAFVNHQAETLFGYDRDELLGRPVEFLVPEQVRGAHPGHRAQYFADPQVRPMGAGLDLSARRKDGSEFPAEISLSSIETEEGLLVTAAVRDISERRRTEQLRAMQFAVTRTLSECRSLDDAAPRILRTILTTLGWRAGGIWLIEPAAEVIALRYRHAASPDAEALEAVSGTLHLTLGQGLPGRVWATGAPVTGDLTEEAYLPSAESARALDLKGHVGFPILADERVVGVVEFLSHQPGALDKVIVGIMADVGRQIGQFIERRRAEAALQDTVARLAEVAATDPLTGLHNRREFERLLDAANRRRFAVLAIDVDNLKQVNDEFGHEAGDVVLRAVGQTLVSLLRSWDVAARIGGDEFAVVMLDATAADAATAGERMRAAVRALSVPYGQARISVGWAAGEAGSDAMAVWRQADEELFRAKRTGRDTVVGADADRPIAYLDRSAWTQRVERALGERRLGVVYQPIVRLADMAVIGHEALARPEGVGLSDSAEEFFKVVHKIGRIRDVDWLCRRMAVAGVPWPAPSDWSLFVNVSAMTLMDPVHDVDQLLLVMEAAGADPEQVVLEITEREIITDLARLGRVLASYRERGFRFAVDDVGEGHSTLELLVAANPEFLKIARGLTMTTSRPGSRAAINAAVAFAESSGAAVLAEGIENALVADEMAELGIPLGQGWWLGRPASLPAFSSDRSTAACR